MAILLSVSVQAKEKTIDEYSNKESELVFYVLVFKEICEIFIPDFRTDNYNEYVKWERKYRPLIDVIKKNKNYIAAISRIYDEPNTIPRGEELATYCKNVAQEYRINN